MKHVSHKKGPSAGKGKFGEDSFEFKNAVGKA